jgi:DNA-binding XRE family transcriptional regulator
MDKSQFARWRRTLSYTQEEAAEKLGVVRSTIMNWEGGATRIPQVVELACLELTRRWKQRPDFGPVSLVYALEKESSRRPSLQCAVFSNNEAAIKEAIKLLENVIPPLIIEDGGGVVWSASELLQECERRRDESKTSPHTAPIAPTSTKQDK